MTWQHWHLRTQANRWLKHIHRRTSLRAGENSLWWSFIYSWHSHVEGCLEVFARGQHRFSPMTQINFQGEVVRYWQYADRLMVKLILQIIKPTLKHIISKRCYHLQGPAGVKTAIRAVTNALEYREFNYVIRGDIKGYYASISREKLTTMLHEHFQDPRLHNYFSQIVNIAVERRGEVFVPPRGIPRRSSLSPFFGALYLSALDKAFEKRKGIAYVRYMDDFIILAQTKRQYQRARKILFKVLASLELKLSPSKTKMGPITHPFHFLGALFEVSQNPQTKLQVNVQIHSRSCARALDRVNALRNDAVHPATMQRYLVRWSSWWSSAIPSNGTTTLLTAWICHAAKREPEAVWIGQGLIP